MKVSKSQVICWDRGRPARNEREARKWIGPEAVHLRRIAGGTPAVPAHRLTGLGLIVVVISLCSVQVIFSQSRNNKVASPSSSSFVLTTEPNAIVWIDEIRR